MRLLLATAILAAPTLAMGQNDPIPETTLRGHYQGCLSECTATRDDDAYCSAVCGCVTDELRQHFTAAEYKERAMMLSEDPEHAEVHNEMNQIAAYCAQRLGM